MDCFQTVTDPLVSSFFQHSFFTVPDTGELPSIPESVSVIPLIPVKPLGFFTFGKGETYCFQISQFVLFAKSLFYYVRFACGVTFCRAFI